MGHASRSGLTLELFPCAGGMAEGFRRAGIDFAQAFDYSSDACDSYKANLGHRPVQIDVHDLVRMVREGWSPGAVDLFVADPPCTPWSRAGSRKGTEDERDCLVVTCELVAALKPTAWLIANVPGLDDGPNWPVVQRTIGALSKLGYCIDFARLNASSYGVPQHRVRPFWFGHARGGACLRWPEPTHCDPKDLRTHQLPGVGAALRPWATCRDALGHLSVEDLGRPVRLRWKEGTDHRPSEPSEPAKAATGNQNGDGALLALGESRLVGSWANGNHLPSRADEPALTVTAAGQSSAANVLVLSSDPPKAKRRPFQNPHPTSKADEPAPTLTTRSRDGGGGGAQTLEIAPGKKRRAWTDRHPTSTPEAPSATVGAKDRGPSGNALEWPWARPSTTITTRGAIPPPGHHPESGSILSLPDAVILSEKARAILQGFPEDWKFCGKTKDARSQQIGMAMPPPMAEAVARAIVMQMASVMPKRKAGR